MDLARDRLSTIPALTRTRPNRRIRGRVEVLESVRADMRYYAVRLEDPALMGRATVVSGRLAVPVGGTRRGGCLSLSSMASARTAVRHLTGRNGFPNVQLRPALDAECASTVVWGYTDPQTFPEPGDDAPAIEYALTDIRIGLYYGYHQRAIETFVTEHYVPEIASAALESEGLADSGA